VEFPSYDRHRSGIMEFKTLALSRDGYRCRQCGARITYEESQADHIRPVNSFASYRQAHSWDNIQTLCLEFHKGKTCRSC